jgi:thiol-disulfide isomerase/thioredoxin
MIMRLPIAILIGFGLLTLMSCNEAPQAEPETSAPEAGSTALNTDSTPDPDSAVPVARGGEGHAHVSGHAGQHPDSGGRDWHRGGSHGHGHAHADHPGDDSKTIAIGDKVPDFEVVIDGKKWMLSELQADPTVTSDGTLVLTFWCSFCHSCRHVEHQLDSLATQYRGKVGVIALDASAGETAEKVAEFAAKQGLTLPIALSSGGAAADIFGTRVTTTTVVIDGNGLLRYCGQFGDRENSFAQDALEAVLAGEEVPVKKTRQKG